MFDLERILDALNGTPFAGRVQHFESVTSTNILALEAAQAGAAHGSVWVADEQTAGRGRGGHQWHSRAGDGLYVSVLLRPQMALAQALWLSLATGLAVQNATIDLTGLSPDIRWPNDLLLGARKYGGILVETAATAAPEDAPAMLRYAVVGIGINVNHTDFPDELKGVATSLRQETGVTWRREELLIALLSALQRQVAKLEMELGGASTELPLLERFSAASSWVRGKRVNVEEAGGYTGVTAGLDASGFLRVAADDGVLRTVISGGVRAQTQTQTV